MIVLSAPQTRQLIDCEQIYAAYRASQREYRQRFVGAMSWKKVGGREYLYRKKDGAWMSLGPRTPETEISYARFREGRAALKARRASLDEEIRAMAPVNKAMRLGRVPWVSARILRRLEAKGLLGQAVRVAGTHALFAYERMGGVHFRSEAVTTLDIDLLFDARSGMRLLASDEGDSGLLDLIRTVDRSFALTEPGSYRAANDKGFLVGLITPAVRNPATAVRKSQSATEAGDLSPVEIEGLTWLESSPTIEQVVIDEKGYPLTIVAPDPRSFALHKAWLASRDDRDPVKKRRDKLQARLVASMVRSYLPHLGFDDPKLNALPERLRDLSGELMGDDPPSANAAPWDERES